MNVFISYGGLTDQVTALRLQALASVNGLTVYVPAAHTRVTDGSFMDTESERRLRESDVVLGVVGTAPTEACTRELTLGSTLRKQLIVMAYPAFFPELQAQFTSDVILVDPTQPGVVEQEIVRHLGTMSGKKSSSAALVALGTLALGLLLFAETGERN
ncbi:MAG TPA: hypothetical protein VHC90_24515 [Bryobacteraceae bacterium]|nr:hypothetical protein [Bryobacteraceae bacterium]